VAADVGQRRLGGFPHDIAELAGDREVALAGGRGRLDEQHVAAEGGPGEARRDARRLRAALRVGVEPRPAEQLADPVGPDADAPRLGVAPRHAPWAVAAGRLALSRARR